MSGEQPNVFRDAPPAQPAGAFLTQIEMQAAMRESEKRLGQGAWTKDEALMRRIAATPKHIKDRW